MHEIKTDIIKNRLYIAFGGFSSLEAVDITSREVKEAVARLKPGFDVITDISNYRPARPEIAQAIQQMQVYLKEAGMRRAIRVLSESAITSMQFRRTSEAAGYKAEMVSSVEDAEKLLEG